MDRFKFRVWVDGTMCDPFSFEDIYNAAFAELKPSQVFEKYTFMQCTGLKDKNGKLIFEGDIIEHRYKFFETQPEIVSRLEVLWEDEYSAFSGFNNNKIRFSIGPGMRFLRDFEIIGNIYENPELLEEGK